MSPRAQLVLTVLQRAINSYRSYNRKYSLTFNFKTEQGLRGVNITGIRGRRYVLTTIVNSRLPCHKSSNIWR